MTLEDFLPDTVIEMIKEGKDEGNLDGRCRAKFDSVNRLLKKKFRNGLNEEIIGKLGKLSLAQLEKVEEIIIDRIFTLNSLEEVNEILESVSL